MQQCNDAALTLVKLHVVLCADVKMRSWCSKVLVLVVEPSWTHPVTSAALESVGGFC